jgi:hypothetical protein
LGAGSKFSIEVEGKTLEYRVEAVGFRSNDDSKWLKAIPLEDEAAFRLFQGCDLEQVKPSMP